ncbi:hypothetical protein ACHAPZ_008275 [Fusarium culmorum]
MTASPSTSLFKNPSLMRLYLLLVPGSLIVSAAMGYDSSLMNGIQGVNRWQDSLQALPAIVNLVGLWFLPESPRWLVGQDRHEDARAILIKYHAGGDENSAFVAAEFEEIRAALQLELARTRSWKELVQTKANRHRTFLFLCCAFFPQWSGNGLVSYYIAPVLRSIGINSQEDITLISGILQIGNMIVAMTGANLVNRVGRRPLFIVATSCMLADMVAWTITGSVFARTKSEATGAGILTCVIFFASSYNICWNPLAVAYPVEILPFNIRAKGIALLMGSIKGASFFNQFVNPIGLKNLGWKYYIVYCVWLCFVLLTVFFMFPETKNRSLEEISEVFEKYSDEQTEKKLEATSVKCVEHRKGEKN